ncbi:MAG TPA: acetate/propionate family kinase [Gemmataceae bacterium]|jgi:acetate kinase|nr:acetate/propionate family kinase [Gemmataceae bacterium]
MMKVLLLNAGSSSLKCTLTEPAAGAALASSLADWAGPVTQYHYTGPDGRERSEQVPWRGHAEAVRRVLYDLLHVEPAALPERSTLAAVGHRVVHGGPFTSSVRITPAIRSRITALADLAPLHNPPSLDTLAAAEAELPGVPQVAVFDTAFHATLPPEARTYPVPEKWTADWGICRYGFHGLSHAYCSQRAAVLLGRPLEELRLVICHLGGGCSDSAVRGGRCVATTMGFTPLDGLMMATRSGSIDPSIVLHVQRRHGLTAEQVEVVLNHESGLLGVSGVSGDMRQVLAAVRAGNPRAHLALAMYTRRVRQAVGALTVTMGGIDALVFTAGVGEHAPEVRAAVCDGLECLGLELDAQANASCRPDADVARGSSRGRILIIATREDETMLGEVIEVLRSPEGPMQRGRLASL